jgi:hypothetical protein
MSVEIHEILTQTLQEEEETDEKLTGISAEANGEATDEAEDDEEDEDEEEEDEDEEDEDEDDDEDEDVEDVRPASKSSSQSRVGMKAER